MVRIVDIAERAGCSIAAVSRVLSLNPHKDARVADETRSHIQQVAQEMGYRPNRLAEFMKRGKSPIIGVFLPKYANRLVADLVFGLSEAAAAAGFPLALSFEMGFEAYARFLEDNIQSTNCGMISYPWFQLDRRALGLVDDYLGGGGKMVLLDVEGNDAVEDLKRRITHVSIDNRGGGALAAEALLRHPCKSHLVLSPRKHRLEGFADALAKAGVHDLASLGTCDNDFLEGEGALREVLAFVKEGDRLPCGIFATSDRAALRAMTYLMANGVAIGKDVFLVGYDDLYLSEWTCPGLTSVRQPFQAVGRLAVEKLVRLIYEKDAASETLRPELVARGSA